MKIAHKTSGSFPKINLGRLQLRSEIMRVLNGLINDVYGKREGFDLDSIEIIVEGKTAK